MNQTSANRLRLFVGSQFIVIGLVLGYHALLPDGVWSNLVGSLGSIVFGLSIVLRRKIHPVRYWMLLTTAALCSVFHLMSLLTA